MKLSEVLKDWPEKKEFVANGVFKEVDSFKGGFNTALTSCDREIDREALANLIMDINFESYRFSHEDVAYKTADNIISTMPTWLKRSDGK